jgi:hypothetical protein
LPAVLLGTETARPSAAPRWTGRGTASTCCTETRGTWENYKKKKKNVNIWRSCSPNKFNRYEIVFETTLRLDWSDSDLTSPSDS